MSEVSRRFKTEILGIKERLVRIRRNLVLSITYLFLTLLMTYPSIKSLARSPIGDGGDSWQFIWNLWWLKKSLMEGLNPYFTDYMFHPTGVDLSLHTHSFLNSSLAFVLQLFSSNLVLIYNLIVILSFVLTGLATYHMVNYFSKDKLAAFLASLVFTFSSYRMAHTLGHLNLISVQWLPLYFLFLYKSIKEDSYWNPVLSALFFSFLTLSSYYYGVYALALTFLLLLYLGCRQLFGQEKMLDLRVAARILLIFIVFSLLVLPVVAPTLRSSITFETSKEIFFKASPSFYFQPHRSLFLYRWLGKTLNLNLMTSLTNGAEEVIFLGYTFLILAFVSLRRKFKLKKFWWLSCLLFFLLSFGFAPLFEVIRGLPIIKVMRNPIRYSLLVNFFLLVPFAEGVKEIKNQWLQRAITKKVFFVVVAILLLSELAWLPYPNNYFLKSETTKDYMKSLARKQGTFAIFNSPHNLLSIHSNKYMYLQTLHEHRIVGGGVSRYLGNSSHFEDYPFLDYFIGYEKAIEPADCPQIRQQLESNSIKYVILYKRLAGGPHKSDMCPSFAQEFENADIVSFKVY